MLFIIRALDTTFPAQPIAQPDPIVVIAVVIVGGLFVALTLTPFFNKS
jgi:hypothetical protein